jgi:hypothetical protein
MKSLVLIFVALVSLNAAASTGVVPVLVVTQGPNYKCEVYSNKVVIRVNRSMPRVRSIKLNLPQLTMDVLQAAREAKISSNYKRALHMTATNPPIIVSAIVDLGTGPQAVLLKKDASDVIELGTAAGQNLLAVANKACSRN